MANHKRTHTPPPELTEMVQDCIQRRGIAGACRAIGVSRGVLLAVAAGAPVLSGSIALLREAYRRRDERHLGDDSEAA